MKKPKFKKGFYKLVWKDAFGVNTDWSDINQITEHKECLVTSVGKVIETELDYFVVPHMHEHEYGGELACGVMTALCCLLCIILGSTTKIPSYAFAADYYTFTKCKWVDSSVFHMNKYGNVSISDRFMGTWFRLYRENVGTREGLSISKKCFK